MFKAVDAHFPKATDMEKETTVQSEVAKYVRKDVFEEYRKGMEERCSIHENQIKALEERQKGIDRKITATLVFVIASLVAILSAICTGLFH